MAMTVDEGVSSALAIRSSTGVELWSSLGTNFSYEASPHFTREESKNCRTIIFSFDGRYFALANGSVVKIISTNDWKEVCSLPRPKASHLKFSPCGNYIVTWELFAITKAKPEDSPNLFVYKTENGKEVYSLIQKKQSEWEPCWSSDESIFALMIGGEAHFYELNGQYAFDKSAYKLGSGRNGMLSLGPGPGLPFLAYYVAGAKGAPSMCKIYKYPALQQNQMVACKSFFQSDRVEMLWNRRGSGLLLLTSTEVDQTGASYYGKQALHFMSTKGDSFSVQLAKDGPIHSVTWSPKSTEFVVVYGYMPAKATLFNLKCDILVDFGDASRNCSYFNDFGNLLILAGFGNLRGYVEVWDMNKRKKISSLQAPDSTLLEWGPTGEIFVTATTSPRLRIANGFKIWHYSGALLHETLWPQGQELLEVLWQKYGEGVFKERPLTKTKIIGIKSSQPEASKQVYQPPNVRLMKEGKLFGNGDLEQSIIPGLPPGYTSKTNSSSNSNRQRKLRNNKDNKTLEQGSHSVSSVNSNHGVKAIDSIDESSCKQKEYQSQQKNRKNNRIDRSIPPADLEKNKKIRNINKRLQDITKLKNKQIRGESLEANQIAKIATESDLTNELKTLKLST